MWSALCPKCFDKEYFDVRVVIPKYMCMKEEYQGSRLEYITQFLYGSRTGDSQYVGILAT